MLGKMFGRKRDILDYCLTRNFFPYTDRLFLAQSNQGFMHGLVMWLVGRVKELRLRHEECRLLGCGAL
jgi:hypothetical protein